MHRRTNIAVVCNYQIKDSRIGSMDRFFIAFDKACKNKDYQVDWFFPKSENIELYNEVNVYTDNNSSVESLILNHVRNTKTTYNYIFTHFVELYTPFYKQLKREFDCKVFAVDHMSRPIGGFSLKKKVKRKLKYFIYKDQIDNIIAVSHYIKLQNLKDYGNRLKSKIEVIYNGIDIALYTDLSQSITKASSKLKFIVVSHLVYEKGVQDLILALHKLDDDILNKINIDVYGEGIYKTVLADLIHKFNLKNVVKFKGSIPNIYSVYKHYDYMIQPTYMEAFSLSVLESLCSNVPVITTKVGGNTEIIKHGVNGYLFEAKDIEQLKNILTNVCNDNLTLENSNMNDEIRNGYSLDMMVNNYLKLI